MVTTVLRFSILDWDAFDSNLLANRSEAFGDVVKVYFVDRRFAQSMESNDVDLWHPMFVVVLIAWSRVEVIDVAIKIATEIGGSSRNLVAGIWLEIELSAVEKNS
jgi:hypothetical protein